MLDDRRGDSFVAFEHVQKSYDGQTLVVKDLNLSIGKGEFLTMLGPSGSGKTTFLNMLTGLARVPKGRVAWDDTDLAMLGEGARDRWRAGHVGLVMQDFHLFPGLSALENVLLPQRLRWRGAAAGAHEEALRLLARTGVPRPGQGPVRGDINSNQRR